MVAGRSFREPSRAKPGGPMSRAQKTMSSGKVLRRKRTRLGGGIRFWNEIIMGRR